MKINLIILVCISLLGCKKPEDRSCWKVAGDDAVKIVELEHFYTLYLGPHIEYTLIQDTMEFVEIEGAENLLNLVTTKIEDNKLSIDNTNKCNFLRSFKKKGIHVIIHFISIGNIEFQGTEPLRSKGVLNIPYFTFLIKDGAGPVDLTLNSEVVFGSISHGYGDFTIKGFTKYANFSVSSNGYCNTRELQVQDSLDVISNSSVLTRFNFNGAQVRAEIKSTGNIEYIGMPSSLDFVSFGTGQLLDGN